MNNNINVERKLDDRQIRTFIKKINKTEETQMQFIAKVMTTFGLRFSVASQIFRIPESELGANLRKNIKSKSPLLNAVFNLEYYGGVNQDYATSRFYQFMDDLYQAYLDKDREKVVALVSYINDGDMQDFKANHKPGEELSEKEVIMLLNYQFKYWISPTNLCSELKISYAEYLTKVEALKETHPEIYESYEKLVTVMKSFLPNEYWSVHHKFAEMADKKHLPR